MSLRGKGKLQLEPRPGSSEPPSATVTIVHAAGEASDSPPLPQHDPVPSSQAVNPTPSRRPSPAPSPTAPRNPEPKLPTIVKISPTPSPAPSPAPSRTSTWGRLKGTRTEDGDSKGSRGSWYTSWPARGFSRSKGKGAAAMENDEITGTVDMPAELPGSEPKDLETQTNGKATASDSEQQDALEDTIQEQDVPIMAPEGHSNSIAVGPPSESAPVSPVKTTSETSSSQPEEPAQSLEAREAEPEPTTQQPSASRDDANAAAQQSWLWWAWGKSAPVNPLASRPAPAPAPKPNTESESLTLSPPKTVAPTVTEVDIPHSPPLPSILPSELEAITPAPVPDPSTQAPASQAETTTAGQATPVQPRPSSWWFWGAAAKPQEVPTTETPKVDQESVASSSKRNSAVLSESQPDPEMPSQQPPENPPNTTESQPQPATNSAASSIHNAPGSIAGTEAGQSTVTRSSAWAFWPKANRSTDTFHSATSGAPHTEPVSRADSPAPGTVKSQKSKSQPPSPPSGLIDGKSGKTVAVAGGTKPTEIQDATIPAGDVAKKLMQQPPSPAKSQLQKVQRAQAVNHVFPSFESCYWKIDQPGLLCRLTRVFSRPEPSKKHLYITPNKARIKKAVAIGVHGFFPMKLVRTVLGEPTGTSRRFATHAASAIKRWAEKEGVEVEVEAIALEGEGKVADRVEMLWKLLEKWMDHVKNADFVMVAAHSQGAVVGMKLLARLIEYGCVDNARVGFLAMAGINLGPFYHLPQGILSGSAKELFEFQRTDSLVSRKYIQAIRTVLAHHARILYVGSIDDQLVPLESSTFANITHPYIFRAVFVDGRIHAPDFLSHLVGFALKLRNLGISDHGLIRELSTPLAGSLYGGEGHSRIYDDGAVYDLAIRHALETTECPEVPLRVEPFELPTNTNNPFFLPWAMRGLLEEEYVRTALHRESKELLEQFERWKPASKVLKDVKFRLEGIRSKL